MRRRSFIFGGIFGGALSSLPRVFKKKGVHLSDFGYREGADNTESLRLAEAAAFLKNQTLVLPKNAKMKLSKSVIFRVSVYGNGAELEAMNGDVFIRIVNPNGVEQVIEELHYNGNNISNGFFIDETKNVLVKNCQIKDCLDVGISIFESDSVQLVHNQIDGTPKLIIDTINSKNITSDGKEIFGQA